MEKKIASLRDHNIVCGAGSTGRHIIQELHQTNRDFVVIENREEVVTRLPIAKKVLYVIGDATQDRVLKKAGIQKAGGIMAVLPEDKDNLFITITARQLNDKMRIISKAVQDGADSKLMAAGADAVVDPHRIGALRIVSEMVRPTVVTFLDQMLRERKAPFRFEEVAVPPGSSWIGRKLSELDLYSKFGISIVAVKHEGEESFQYCPKPETVLAPNLKLVFLGDAQSTSTLQQMMA